ncbi:hypothetical protein PENSPDRAFT_33292 [Peniophora sp. CONT]|nr:hypothetical protein PENSPDRAFT_33292 [Peniophora sp. CONT]
MLNQPSPAADSADVFWTSNVHLRFDGAILGAVGDRGARRMQLEKELESMRRSERLALRLRNKQTGACSLPTEVLTAVFAHAQEIWLPSRRKLGVKNGVKRLRSGWGWITVALNTPSLWTTHTSCATINHNFIPELILRARDFPLSLTFTWDGEIHDDFYDTGAHHWFASRICRRIKSLSFRKLPLKIADHLEWWIRTAVFTALEHLAVETAHQSDSLSQALVQPLSSWKATSAPQLRSLHLDGFHIPWSSEIFSGQLTCLHIELPREIEIDSLSLHQTFPLEYDPDITLPMIHLPRSLRRLNLNSYDIHAHLAMYWFLHLVVPGHCFVCINAFADSYEVDLPLEATLSYLWEQRTGQELMLDAYGVYFDTTRRPHSQWERPNTTWGYPTTGPDGSFYLGITTANDSMLSLTKHILDLPLDTFTAITFTTDALQELHNAYDEPLQDWQGRLCTASAVTRVAVQMEESEHLLDAMTELDSQSEVGSGQFKIFPRLETLMFYVGNALPGLVSRHFERNITIAVALVDLVRLRMNNGVPLREVMVSDQIQHWPLWDSIRAMVGEITFFKDPCSFLSKRTRKHNS